MAGLDSNTKLLLHCNTWDKSATPKTVKADGTVYSTDTVYKFNTHSFSFDGASGYFYLGDSVDWDVCENDVDSWTIELWVRFTDSTITTAEYLIGHMADTSNQWELYRTTGEKIDFVMNLTTTKIQLTSPGTITTADTWYHLAVIKVGDKYGLYINGAIVTYSQDSDNATFTGNLSVGARNDGALFFKGYMDDVHITKSNKYSVTPDAGLTSTFTLPSAALTADAGTKLLLQATEHDDASNAVNPGAEHIPTYKQLSRTVTFQKWGNGSLAFDGNDKVTFPDSDDWDIHASSSSSWTVDMWVKHSTLGPADQEVYVSQFVDGDNFWSIHRDVSGNLSMPLKITGTQVTLLSAASVNLSTEWNHIAVCKVGTSRGLYYNGAQVAYTAGTGIVSLAATLSVGVMAATDYFIGYLDEVRIQNSNYFNAAPNIGTTDVIFVPAVPYSAYRPVTQAVIL
jgi:hypothetical protein